MTNNIERTKRMIEVMQAYVDGERVECRFRGDEKWVTPYDGIPKWRWVEIEYRIAKTPDTINWDHVSPEFKYMARDADGKCWLYRNKPKRGKYVWTHFSSMWANGFSSYRRGTCDWKDSLVIRPGCE